MLSRLISLDFTVHPHIVACRFSSFSISTTHWISSSSLSHGHHYPCHRVTSFCIHQRGQMNCSEPYPFITSSIEVHDYIIAWSHKTKRSLASAVCTSSEPFFEFHNIDQKSKTGNPMLSSLTVVLKELCLSDTQWGAECYGLGFNLRVVARGHLLKQPTFRHTFWSCLFLSTVCDYLPARLSYCFSVSSVLW